MAQASEELLIKIDIVDSDSANRINEISEELNHLKVTQKDYEQAVKEGKQLTTEQAKEYVAVKARIADLNKEVNTHVKALQKEQQEQKKNADSLNSMRAQLKEMIKAYDNLSKAERENAEVGGKQVAMINQLTDQIKELEEGTQRYQRNVGNYANSITKALASQVPAIGSVSNAMIGLKTATGWIGIVIQGAVMLFTALSTAFKRTEGNGDKLTGGLAKMKGLFVMVQQALEPLTKIIVDGFVVAIDKALQAIGWLGEKLQQFLRFVGADEWANKLESFAEKTKETAEATSELAVAEEQLHRKQREARKTMLEYQRQAEELRQTRDDATKSAEEQEEANRKLLALLQEQKKVEGGIQQEAIRVAKLRIQLNGETTENLDALTDAETEYADVIERITGQSSEAIKWQNDRLAVLKEESAILDDIIRKTLDVNSVGHNRQKRQIFDDSEDDEDIEDVVELMLDANKKKQEMLNAQTFEGINERLRLQLEALEIEKAKRIASGEDAVKIAEEYSKKELGLYSQTYQDKIDLVNSYIAVSQASAMNVIDTIEQVAKANGASEEYMKKLAVAKIAINTATAIAQGVSGAMAVGFPANIPAILATITAIVSGMAQAKSALNSANVPKYATGGLVTGEGTATSDSIPAMLSNGESVMTARATSTYSPILSALNTSVGGAPIGESTKTKGTQQLVQQFADAVMNTPIYTAVTDINEGQARVAKIVDNSNY